MGSNSASLPSYSLCSTKGCAVSISSCSLPVCNSHSSSLSTRPPPHFLFSVSVSSSLVSLHLRSFTFQTKFVASADGSRSLLPRGGVFVAKLFFFTFLLDKRGRGLCEADLRVRGDEKYAAVVCIIRKNCPASGGLTNGVYQIWREEFK